VLAFRAEFTFVYGPPDVALRYMLYPTTAEGLEVQLRLTLCAGAAVPDPVRVSTVGELAALLRKEMIPDAVPLVCGVKVRVTDALWPAAIVVGKDKPPRVNSGLVEVAEEIFTLAAVAVRVALRVLLVRMVTLPKFKAVGLEVNPPAEIPLPARAIVKIGFEAFETTAIAPLAVPTTFGAKKILKVMLCPFFRLNGRLKSLK